MWRRKKTKTAVEDKASLEAPIIVKEISTIKEIPSPLHYYNRIRAPRPCRWKAPCFECKNSSEKREPELRTSLKGFPCQNQLSRKVFSQSWNTETCRSCCSRSPWWPDPIPGWQRNFKAIVHIVLQAWRCKLRWSWILKHNFREMLRQGNVWKSWNLAVRPWGATVWSLNYNDDSRMLEI